MNHTITFSSTVRALLIAPLALCAAITSAQLAGCAADDVTGNRGAGIYQIETNARFWAPWTPGVSRQATQGHNGPSHSAAGETFAWDFDGVSPGVGGDEIRAVADGTILRVRNTGGSNCTTGLSCTNSHGNYVVIEHTFGSRHVSSLYLHLQNEATGSALRSLHVGQAVRRGDLVGHMGDTGYSDPAGYAHLHFQFQEVCGSYWCDTVDYQTLSTTGFQDVGVLTVGRYYTAGGGTPGTTPPPTPGTGCGADVYAIWTCTTDLAARVRCNAGHVEVDTCASGCVGQALGTDDTCAAPPTASCSTTGQSCSASRLCCGGLTCSGGTCVTASPPAPTCVALGGSCTGASTCCGTATCQSGTCQTPAAPPPTGGVSWSCGDSSYAGAQYWTCSGGNIYRCQGGTPQMQTCASGCNVLAAGTDDTCATSTPTTPAWRCADSSYSGAQYWTCQGGDLHRCDASGTSQLRHCASGCAGRPLGTDDVCN
ncbi:MAG: M23 family metallopeptidase [Deltaproteobacteria bacterium]